MEWQQPITLLGDTSNPDTVRAIIESLGECESQPDPPDRVYKMYPSKGRTLLFENHRVIDVQICVRQRKKFVAFSYELPYRIRKEMSQNDLHQLLGEPTYFDAGLSSYDLMDQNIRLLVDFDAEGASKAISISPLSSW